MADYKSGDTVNENEDWLLCERCIEAIKSRGERLIILDELNQYTGWDEPMLKCSWCDEPEETLYKCD